MGAPPHGGFAMGLERFVALMAGEPDIRQIVAVPEGLERRRSADRRADADARRSCCGSSGSRRSPTDDGARGQTRLVTCAGSRRDSRSRPAS